MEDQTDSQRPSEDSEALQSPKRLTPYDFSKLKVLIVEDCSFIASILFTCLSTIGVGKVYIASSGEDAREKILNFNSGSTEKKIDLVITDWLMPNSNGESLIIWMREHKSDAIRFLPVIVCSAYTSQELVFRARDAGANEVLVKPVSADGISKRILSIIDQPRPFIKAPKFKGPDRRRRDSQVLGADRRKTKKEDIKVSHEQR